MTVHWIAKFLNDLKVCYDIAVKRISKYLLSIEYKGLICIPDKSKGMEIFINADFARGFNK